jgi:hypothetical protein
VRCSRDLPGQSLLPIRACALQGRNLLSLLGGQLPVYLGKFGYRFTQQWTTMIATAGVFDVDKGLVGVRQTNCNLAPHRRARTIALPQHRLSRSQTL